MQRGCFIAFEGIDGSGKSSQLMRLAAYLRERGLAVYTTAEPSTGLIGVLIRTALAQRKSDAHNLDEDTIALLFAADRLAHLQREIDVQLSTGHVVLCDRYVLSSLAYQAVAIAMTRPQNTTPHDVMPWLLNINRNARAPDATLYLRVSQEVASQRRRDRNEETMRYENNERQQQVALAFEEAMQRYGNPISITDDTLDEARAQREASPIGPCFIIDGDDDADTVGARLAKLVDLLIEKNHDT